MWLLKFFFQFQLMSRTWKGVVSKNKFDIPSDHENKVGVGASRASSSETRNSSAFASATVQGASKQAKQTPK